MSQIYKIENIYSVCTISLKHRLFRLLDIETKDAMAILQIIHTSLTEVGKACMDARRIFEKCRSYYEKLECVTPVGQYYRFSDHWNFTTQRLISLIALVIYLEKGFLVSRETCAEILGLKVKQSDGFHLDLETYLMVNLNLMMPN